MRTRRSGYLQYGVWLAESGNDSAEDGVKTACLLGARVAYTF